MDTLCTRHWPSCSPVHLEKSTPVIKRLANCWHRVCHICSFRRHRIAPLFTACPFWRTVALMHCQCTKWVHTLSWLLFPSFATRVWIVLASLVSVAWFQLTSKWYHCWEVQHCQSIHPAFRLRVQHVWRSAVTGEQCCPSTKSHNGDDDSLAAFSLRMLTLAPSTHRSLAPVDILLLYNCHS